MATIYESKIKCNCCMAVFYENELIYDGDEDMDFCPYCGEGGSMVNEKKTTPVFPGLSRWGKYLGQNTIIKCGH